MKSESRYPLLVDLETGERYEILEGTPFIAGRSPTASLPVFDTQCARRQFQIVARSGQYFLEPLPTSNPTYCNGKPVQAPLSLTHGHTIGVCSSRFMFMERDDSKVKAQTPASRAPAGPGPTAPRPQPGAGPVRTQIRPNQPPAQPVGQPMRQPFIGTAQPQAEQLTTIGTSSGAGPATPLGRSFAVTQQMLIGRDADKVSIHLPHSQVSRLHAQVSVRGREVYIDDLRSANGTFVNGKRITESTLIKAGDNIDIGPYALVFSGKSLLERSRVNNVELACEGLSRVVKNRETGGSLTLLDDVNLLIKPGEFVCLLGPSGSGKSTLLSALSARAPAETGVVTVNGKNLYANFDALKRDIAVVHQKDLMHDYLSVSTVLRYTAKLRLPPDTSASEVESIVDEILGTVGLTHRANTLIRNLSGGELKRASLANEIISKPSLLFLDEVTSGLDEQTDADLMQLFRTIAEAGKTVICITHSTSNVATCCHKIVVLSKGGRVAFIGTPDEVLAYFDVPRLGDVYNKLAMHPPEHWQEMFRQHQARLNADAGGKPIRAAEADQVDDRIPISMGERLKIMRRQTILLTRRYLQIQLSDIQALAMTLGQCLLVGLFIVLLFGDVQKDDSDLSSMAQEAQRTNFSAQIMFLLSISALWFGCNNAAKEIVKERVIYTRERDVNLLVSSYVASKIILLGMISLFQALLLYGVVIYGTSVDTSTAQLLLIMTLSLAGVGMGLLVSALSHSTDMAVSIVPLILIPQIIFSGMIGKIEGLSELIASIGVIIYWGYGGLISTLPEDMPKNLGFDEWKTSTAWMVVALHAFVYFAATMVVMQLATIREASYGFALDRIVKATTRRASKPSV